MHPSCAEKCSTITKNFKKQKMIQKSTLHLFFIQNKSGIIEQASETFQRIMGLNSYCEIVDKYLYSPRTFWKHNEWLYIHQRTQCDQSRSCSLPLTCHVHSLHFNTCRGRNGGKLQSLWHCLIQTTLLVYLYAVQLGGMRDKNTAQVCKSPQYIWFIINWGSFQSVPKNTLSNTFDVAGICCLTKITLSTFWTVPQLK